MEADSGNHRQGKKGARIKVRSKPYRAKCLLCPWIGEHPSPSVVFAGHYAMKHVKKAHPDAEGPVAIVVKEELGLDAVEIWVNGAKTVLWEK